MAIEKGVLICLCGSKAVVPHRVDLQHVCYRQLWYKACHN